MNAISLWRSMLPALVLTVAAPLAQAVEIMRWERLPLAVPLIVDQERVVFIDRNVRIGIPASLDGRLRVQSAAGAVYLRASAPIEPTRLQLQDADTGTVILLDIAAEAAQTGQPPLEPVRIVETESPGVSGAGSAGGGQSDGRVETRQHQAREAPVPVILTRYAAQNLYAPLRTVEPVVGVVRASLRADLSLDTLLPTLPVQARALAAWRQDDWWISAVRLRNTSTQWLELDPRALQGDFKTAAFQHDSLGPAGTPEDTTVVYLTTRGRGLAQALLPAISPVDATHNLLGPNGALKGGRDEK
ncbi:TIGR03749 family integrating conjugative element protein [Pseudomonas aeruginosa]|uniref:TIGR03749 family integrating conjugative element protein n=1 Tax=Pseudomonas aeruginosa TaxID=287 RepID=UPI000F7D6932|nr:TIGR03749 family integrating conjugative element protein [Pseudomonas aeruginosa]RTB44133.1 TIGR03749 family integrating conjugative element protein [Pseudomonas aeruginosa]